MAAHSAARVLLPLLLALHAPGVPEPQAPEPQVPQQPAAAPDLRIVSIEVAPAIPVDNGTATITVIVHNDSPAAAAGSIIVELVHDRFTPQPVPSRREILFIGGDELEEISFEVSSLDMQSSPYRFFAAVDMADRIGESNEFNNVNWLRTSVCGGAGRAEEPDGRDNDCDGMIDEGLGLPPDTADALRMLRELQRRSAEDRIPLIFGLPRLFAPSPRRRPARLSTEDGSFVGVGVKTGGVAAVLADRSATAPRARLTLVDWNGADLMSGDLVSFESVSGGSIVAEGGGGGMITSRALHRETERLFVIVRQGNGPAPSVEGEPVTSGELIESGDAVFLVTGAGFFVGAEQGGGRELRGDRRSAAGWEVFRLILEEA